ncbi:chlorophyllase/cutinase-like alpha/beta fold protein [Massilia aerilata]|uniref:CocE/NonD family hydrolase n=1 Tax=Massilia aerilata TaxID=453817 RepID=A0ABW0S5U1_9BURK
MKTFHFIKPLPMPRLFTLLLLAASATAGAADTFVFSNEPGPYPVGVQVKSHYDYSRVYRPAFDLVTGQPETHERARPIQAVIWYPARARGKPLAWRDYAATWATEDTPWLTAAEVQRATDMALAGLPPALARQAQTQPMWASKDAPAASGKFPVVIYAASHSSYATENAELCEYLASHGYIVIASRSMGARSKAMTDDLEGLEAQAADIAFLIGQAQAMPQADMSRIAVAGFSWGGLANVLAAARDDRIRALVSLDGSVRSYPQYVDGGKDAARYATPARLAVPMLYVGRERESIEALVKGKKKLDYSLLNEMTYADMTIVTMRPMTHGDFASVSLHFANDKRFNEYSRDEVSLAHSWTARYVARFLDAYLKNDAQAMAFLDNQPSANKAPAHMLSVERRKGRGTPPTLEAFVRTLQSGGYEHAQAVYDSMHAANPAFALDPVWLNIYGYDLLRSGRKKEAVSVFRLGTKLAPDWDNIADSLAEAYEAVDERQLAIGQYRRVLELNPGHGHAIERLKALGAEPAAKAAGG